METNKKMIARRPKQEPLRPSFGPVAEEKKTSKGESTVSEVQVLNLQRNAISTASTPKAKKELTFLGHESPLCATENTLSKTELMVMEQIKGKPSLHKLSFSTETQSMDNLPLKRPIKLAPLNLPTEVKEAQLQKIMAIKDEAFLAKQKLSKQFCTDKITCEDKHMKGDPLNKVNLTEKTLPDMKKGNNCTTEKIPSVLTDFPLIIKPAFEKTQEAQCTNSKSKFKGSLQDPFPNNIKMNPLHSHNISAKGHFSSRHVNNQEEKHNRAKPVKTIGLNIECPHQKIGVEKKEKEPREPKKSFVSK
ncbi:uncharacterized protein LOC142476405 [Ascaphus truei]|uniref:uncharacterized protein LOC142476405 n=1 Tax=Ascaphus truei TaxID=8439 RepID=UPI003F5A49C2